MRWYWCIVIRDKERVNELAWIKRARFVFAIHNSFPGFSVTIKSSRDDKIASSGSEIRVFEQRLFFE